MPDEPIIEVATDVALRLFVYRGGFGRGDRWTPRAGLAEQNSVRLVLFVTPR